MIEDVNGVDRQQLFDTIEAVKADNAIAEFQFRLENRWVNGSENRSTIGDYFGAKEALRHTPAFELTNDEPPKLLGQDRAPNPVEYVLHALAGCMTTTLVYHAAARGIEIRSVKTRFEGDLDLRGFLDLADDVRSGYRRISVAFDIEGDFDEQTKEELIATAKRFSPVFDIVSNGVPLDCKLADEQASPGAAAA